MMRRPKPDLPPPPELPSFRVEPDAVERTDVRDEIASILDRHEGTKLSRHDAPLEDDLIDADAAKVVRRLERSGYQAYLVGGCVRDLLLGGRPKDFDVATNATPEQVKGLFRRAFIIGRRFRIVHVVFGRGREHEVIEVSTFRAYMDSAAAEQVAGNEKTSRSELAGMKHAVDASGRVLRDNVWGPVSYTHLTLPTN